MKKLLLVFAVVNALCAIAGAYFIASGAEYPILVFVINTVVAGVNMYQAGTYDL